LNANRNGPESTTAVHWSRYVILVVLLMVAWVLWSGYLKPLLLGLGLLSSILVVYLDYRMRLKAAHYLDGRFLLRLVRYWGWLAREVVRSSLDVTRIVLSPKLPISPTVAEFNSRCILATDQALLGNSITLTPGTLTIQIEEGHFVVHALTEAGARDILGGEMDRRVAALRED
jgi:multicomponent Na+:H+ antiporter subunit E